MSPTQLLRLLLTALGIFFIGYPLTNIVFFLSFVVQAGALAERERLDMWIGMTGPLVTVLFGVSLIAFRDRLTHRLQPPSAERAAALTDVAFHTVGLSIVGAFFMVQGAADIGQAAVFGYFHGFAGQFDASLGGAVAKFLLGLAVFLGAPGLTGLWRLLRTGGT